MKETTNIFFVNSTSNVTKKMILPKLKDVSSN